MKLRYRVQQTGSGAGKERCPSRGIALMFNGPHSDVPCHQAPQVAYIVMFVTQWHKNPAAKIQLFRFGWQTRKCRVKCRCALRERGKLCLTKKRNNYEIRNIKQFKIFFDSGKKWESWWEVKE